MTQLPLSILSYPYLSYQNIKNHMGSANSKLQKYGSIVREEQDKKIEEELNVLLDRKKLLNISDRLQDKIVKSSATELVQMLNKREVNSKQLVTVFSLRSATVGMDYNLITEENFQMAYELAEKCDEIRANRSLSNWTIGEIWDQSAFLPPLFGIPFSVKDNFDMVGKRTTLGLTVRAHDIKEIDCGLISCLKESGMIPFVRTNVSQMTMSFECSNYLWGRSINVWNKERGVGGSSGGEAGLIAAKCSPLGIGTDVGGSLRIPAQFSGISSFKPSDRRISSSTFYSTQFSKTITGKDTFTTVYGPMGRNVDDLALWMKTVLTEKFNVDNDFYTKIIPFDDKTYLSYQKRPRLRIGYFASTDLIETTPATQRAVLQTVNLLRKLGHELIEIEIPNFEKVVQGFLEEVTCQGKFRSFDKILQGESVIPEYKKVYLIAKLPWLLRYGVKAILRKMAPRMSVFLQKSDELSVEEYLTHVGEIQQYKKEFCDMWKSMNLDHIIAPGFGCQANIHGLSDEVTPCSIYTFIWNVFGFISGALPITVVKEDEQVYESKQKDMLTAALKKNAIGSAGLPVGIQVIGKPYDEEKVLALMKVIESAVEFNRNHRPREEH